MAVSSDSLRLGIVEESTAGTTPTTPAYDLFRTVGEGLSYEVTTTQSDEMGGINRGIKESVLTGATVTGNIDFELSRFKSLEELMASVLGNTWTDDPLSVPGVDANISYNASILRTFTIEKRFTLDNTPTYNYHRFVGCLTDTISLSITPNESITGSLTFVGNEMTTESTEIAGSTYALAGTNPIMTAPLVTGIELLDAPGIDDTTGAPLGSPVAWASDACFTGIEISLNNNSRALACIGLLGTSENVFGRFQGTASGSLYYNGPDALDGLIDHTEFALRVTMSDDDGETYQYFFPRVVFNSATANAGGTNTDLMTEFELELLEYQGDDYALSAQLTRSTAA